jgi:ribosomal protein S18 acetylase RimI-like enzyme
MTSKFIIKPARSGKELDSILKLFRSYAESLEIDLAFQDFSQELSSLPGKYSPPTGELFIAIESKSASPIGCVAVRPLPLSNTSRCCEMKRLYVASEGRGLGLGRALAMEALSAAQHLGYEQIRLDTLPSMITARQLYESLGFEECEKYYDTPLEGTVFLAKNLITR